MLSEGIAVNYDHLRDIHSDSDSDDSDDDETDNTDITSLPIQDPWLEFGLKIKRTLIWKKMWRASKPFLIEILEEEKEFILRGVVSFVAGGFLFEIAGAVELKRTDINFLNMFRLCGCLKGCIAVIWFVVLNIDTVVLYFYNFDTAFWISE